MSSPGGFQLSTQEAQQRVQDVEDTVHRVTKSLSDYEDQTQQLNNSFQGQTAHTFQAGAAGFQSDMADVTQKGNQLIDAARDAINKLVSADAQ
jgi:uncharacterized protein YukE